MAPAAAPAPAYADARRAGQLGKIRGTGACIGLMIITFGIYIWWYFKTHEEMKQHSGQGIGGAIALILALFVGIVLPYINSGEVGESLRARGPAIRSVPHRPVVLPGHVHPGRPDRLVRQDQRRAERLLALAGRRGLIPAPRSFVAPASGYLEGMLLRLVAGATALALTVTLSPSGAAPAPPGDRAAQEVHLGRGGQDRLRHRALDAQQRLVHAPGRPGQRGVLPGPVDAERAQPRVPVVGRGVQDTLSKDADHGRDPPGPAQPAVHAGRHRRRRPLPRRPGVRHRPEARHARRPGPAGVARRRRLPALRAVPTRRSTTAAATTGRRPVPGRAASRPTARCRAPSSRAATCGATLDARDRPRQHRPGRRAARQDRGHARARFRRHCRPGREPGARARSRGRLRRDAGGVRPRLAPVPRRAEGRAGERGARRAAVPRLRAGARRRRGQAAPRRLHRLAVRALGVGRRGEGPVLAVGRLPPGLVARRLPVRHRALGDGRPGRRAPDRRWLFGTQQKADGSFPQNSDVVRHAGVGAAAARRGRAADRARAPRRRGRRARPGAACARRRSSWCPSGTRRPAGGRRTRPRSGGRTSPATRPTRSPPRSPGWSARPTWPARRAPMRSRGSGSRSPTGGSGRSRTGRSPATDRCRTSRTSCG